MFHNFAQFAAPARAQIEDQGQVFLDYPHAAKTVPQFMARLNSRSKQCASAPLEQAGERQMKINNRFIKSVVETASKNETDLPWARGARRTEFQASRQDKDSVNCRLKSA